MLLKFTSTLEIERLLDIRVIIVYLLSAITLVSLSFWFLKKNHYAQADSAFGALVAVSPNTGFMGVAMVTTLMGAQASGPVIVAMLLDMLFTSTLCIILSQQTTRNQGAMDWRIAVTALRNTLSNPLPWAIALGVGLSAADITLTGIPKRVVDDLAASGTPVALFAIGAALGGMRINTDTVTVKPSVLLGLSMTKLVLHPLAVFSIATVAMLLGLGLSSTDRAILTLAAALPSAGNAMMLGLKYGAAPSGIAMIVLSTTSFAVISVTIVAWLLI